MNIIDLAIELPIELPSEEASEPYPECILWALCPVSYCALIRTSQKLMPTLLRQPTETAVLT